MKMNQPFPLPPGTLVDATGRILDGVYQRGVADPQLAGHPWRRKEWQYLSVTTDAWFLGLALVQTGYVGNLFAYVVDRSNPSQPLMMERLSPLGRAVQVAPSSLQGTSRWHSRGQRVTVTAQPQPDGTAHWHWQIDLQLLDSKGKITPLHADLTVTGADALALIHTLPTGKAAYTHKEAGQTVAGTLTCGPIDWHGETTALATLDWTRALALRTTRWKWASGVGILPDGRRLGLNLSAEVYDDAAGHSRENALWLDGAVQPLGGVRFTLPADPLRQPWQIRSLRGGLQPEVDLTFAPQGARQQHLELGLLASRFVQPYGVFTGTIRPQGQDALRVDGLWGVVEDHVARW